MGINLGQTSMKAVYLGQTAVKSVFFGDKQVWGQSPVVPEYDIQSIGRSTSEQGTSIEISEQAGETITLYIKTNATDLTNKQVCAAAYLDSTDATPYATFAFSNVSLASGYITGTTPDVSAWVPNGFPDTYSTLYMKTWIQDAGYIDPADALGEVLDWTGEEPVPVGDWLCFTAEAANSKLQLDKVGSPGAVSLEYSTDGVTWSDYTWSGSDGATLTLAAVGDKIYMRAKNENQTFSTDYQNYYEFTSYVAPRIAVSGNIQTLLKADGSRTDAPADCFRSLFNGCVWLTQAPNLPATTIGSGCYNNMFSQCTSLTTAPELPAMTLAPFCYSSMFYGCSSLTAAPELPATTLANFCYQNMFYSCSQLSSIEVAFSTWPGGATYSTTNWLNGVAASGTFTCPSTLPDTRGASNIPDGWTKVDAA